MLKSWPGLVLIAAPSSGHLATLFSRMFTFYYEDDEALEKAKKAPKLGQDVINEVLLLLADVFQLPDPESVKRGMSLYSLMNSLNCV